MKLVQAVMVAFLILVVIFIAVMLTGVSLRDVTDRIDTTTVSLLSGDEQTDTVVNETGAFIVGTSALRNCAASLSAVTNTSGFAIPTTNYTLTGCEFVSHTGAGNYFNNTLWNVTGSYTFSAPGTNDIIGNVTAAGTTFFENTSTIFAILIVVVIILAISIVILVVQGFGGRGVKSEL